MKHSPSLTTGSSRSNTSAHRASSSMSSQPSRSPQASRTAHTRSVPAQSSQTSSTSRAPNGYKPVSFDDPHTGGSTSERFYGSLIDKHTNRPTEIFSRLADALFFHLDRACDVPGLRGTGVIEPAKYGWLSRQLGGDARPDAANTVAGLLPSYYAMAGIPHKFTQTSRGPVPVLDRRGWLHLCVFDARADPADMHQHLNKAIARFALRDPATDEPFPTPLPRSALPRHADAALAAQCAAWLAGEVRRMRRERVEAMEDRIRNAARSRYNRYSYMAGAAGAGGATSHFAQRSYSAGAGAGGATSHFAQQGYGNFGGSAGGGGGFGGFGSGFGGGGGGGGGSDNDHATVLDTVNTLGTLANTIFGIAGGGSGLGGGMFGLGTGLFGN